MLAPQVDVSQAAVISAINGYYFQIRHIDVKEGTARIMKAISDTSKAYGARQEITSEVQYESVKLVREKFAHIAPEEIVEAYRQWASGELDNLKKGEAEMYGGQFNAAQLGKILTAYCEKRRKIIGTYLRQQHIEMETAQKEALRKRKQEEFNREFPALIEKMKTEAQDWRDCPFWLYESAKSRGLIRFDNAQEAQAIFQDAMELARLEASNAYAEAQEQGGKSFWQLRELQNAMEDQKGIEARARTIARQITLYRKIVLTNK